MAERMVALKSTIDSMVSVRKPEYGVNRRWQKVGQTQMLPFDIVYQMLWDSGFRSLIDSGILYIEDLQTKKDLGLEPEEATSPVNILVLNEQQMKEYMTSLPIDVFKREVSKLPRIQVDNLVSFAAQNRYTDGEKCYYLKQLCGKDILKMVSNDILMQEIDEKNRAEDERYSRERGRR